MQSQNSSGRKQHIYRLDAATFYELKAIIDGNNKMLQKLKEQEELKDRTIRKLTAERFCLQHLHKSFASKGQDIFGNPLCEE